MTRAEVLAAARKRVGELEAELVKWKSAEAHAGGSMLTEARAARIEVEGELQAARRELAEAENPRAEGRKEPT